MLGLRRVIDNVLSQRNKYIFRRRIRSVPRLMTQFCFGGGVIGHRKYHDVPYLSFLAMRGGTLMFVSFKRTGTPRCTLH